MSDKTILIIEDDLNIRESLGELLMSQGYKTLIQENGKKGIACALQEFPDLIICDIMMPEANGYEVIQALQNHDSLKCIPFIFLSAKSQQSDMRTGMCSGADDYLTKPFKARDLFSAVETRLKKSEEQHRSLSELREGFIEMANHEFRTPLTSIALTAGALKRQASKVSEIDTGRIEKIEKQVFKISKLIQRFMLRTGK